MKHFEKRIEYLLLSILVLIAFVIRFYQLTAYPVGFNADEASFGYDSYSILLTGKDQWGNFLPSVLKSFGDYKSPLYSYIALPFVYLFDLNIFSVRLPNVIVGALAVVSVYLLTNEIFKKVEKTKISIGLVAGVFLALNPWSIMMSRGAFEANLLTLLVPLGVYFFLKGFDKHAYLSLSSIAFGLSFFAYHSSKAIVPILLVVLFVTFAANVKKISPKLWILPSLIFLLFVGLQINATKQGGGARIIERSITQGALEDGAKEKIKLIQSGVNPIVARIKHNKYQVIISRFAYNYKQYFSSKFLLTNGSGEAYYGMVPGIGVLAMVEAIALLGLLNVSFVRKHKKALGLTILWLLVAPIPAALSTGVGYSGNRAIGMIPVLQILEAFGLIGIFVWLKQYKYAYVPIFVLLFILVGLGFKNFTFKYFKNIPQTSYQQMLYGNLEIFKWASNYSEKQIVVSRSLSEPQIFVAFVNKVDPTSYQRQTSEWDLKKSGVLWVDQLSSYNLDNYTIESIDWKGFEKNSIVIAKATDKADAQHWDKIIYYPWGEPAIYAKNY